MGRIARLSLVLALFGGVAFQATAQSFSTTGNWATAGDWTPASVPSGTGTDVTLAANPTINGSNSVTIGSISNSGSYAPTLTVTASGSLTLGSSALFSGGTKKSMTFSNGGTLSISGNSPVEIWGDLNITGSFTLSITGSGSLIVHGNVNVSGGASLTMSGTGAFTIGGNLTAGNNSSISASGSGSLAVTGAISLGTSSTISKSGGSTLTSASCSCSGCQTQCSSVLPVTLLGFYSALGLDNINLKWSTASELNFNYFDLEKSSDGKEFNSIAQVKGHGTTNELHNYSFEDNFPMIGNNYYRLTSVDFDNYRETFNVIVQQYTGAKDFQISPNPSDGHSLNLTFNFEASNGQLAVYDNLGSLACILPVTESGEVIFNSPLKSGIYLVKYSSSSFTKTTRILVQ